jgi:hypothetical protein
MTLATIDELACPGCDYKDSSEGFGTKPLPRKRRADHVQVFVCPRCGLVFAPKGLTITSTAAAQPLTDRHNLLYS